MTNSDDVENIVEITKTTPRLTPPGYKIQLSITQAIAIAEFVDSPVFKILETVYVAQRKDHIARISLNSSMNLEQLNQFRGMASELVLFFKNMRATKKSLKDAEEESDKK